jgi:hypothetical protein
MPSYPVELAIHNLPRQAAEVVASTGEGWILLGRDVMNAHRVVLYGPNLVLEIG